MRVYRGLSIILIFSCIFPASIFAGSPRQDQLADLGQELAETLWSESQTTPTYRIAVEKGDTQTLEKSFQENPKIQQLLKRIEDAEKSETKSVSQKFRKHWKWFGGAAFLAVGFSLSAPPIEQKISDPFTYNDNYQSQEYPPEKVVIPPPSREQLREDLIRSQPSIKNDGKFLLSSLSPIPEKERREIMAKIIDEILEAAQTANPSQELEAFLAKRNVEFSWNGATYGLMTSTLESSLAAYVGFHYPRRVNEIQSLYFESHSALREKFGRPDPVLVLTDSTLKDFEMDIHGRAVREYEKHYREAHPLKILRLKDMVQVNPRLETTSFLKWTEGAVLVAVLINLVKKRIKKKEARRAVFQEIRIGIESSLNETEISAQEKARYRVLAMELMAAEFEAASSVCEENLNLRKVTY